MRFYILLLCALLTACAHPAQTTATTATTASYLLVRHAEKEANAGENPPLTTEGKARAQRLAQLLDDTPLTAIYSSPTLRTQQTAAPTAEAHQLHIVDYDPRNAAAFAAQLRSQHPSGTVLVIGHSNTLPELARQLCQCHVDEMDEAIYGIYYTLTVDAAGRTQIRESRN